MAQNKPDFIPSKFRIRPEFYTETGGRVAAVFRHPATGANVMLEVEVDVWNHADPRNAKGPLLLLYQGSEARHSYTGSDVITSEFSDIPTAMTAVGRVLADPEYGKGLADKPVPVSGIRGLRWPDRTAVECEISAHRAYRRANPYRKPETSFALTDEDRRTLRGWGHPKDDFAQIEQAANGSIYDVTDAKGRKKSVPWDEALKILGREAFLSGISRSAFHWNAERESPDGKTSVYFESGKESPFRSGI